jgi:hypothetical protein
MAAIEKLRGDFDMPSHIMIRRLEALLGALNAGHSGGADVSSHSVGRDRELFINLVLSNIISVPFRIGTGDIVDAHDAMSPQCDIVIEYMNTLSFPNIFPSSARLYLAESVCAVIEVKSTISTQWPHVVPAAQTLHTLERDPGTTAVFEPPPKKIPFFAVGYTGWKNMATAAQNLDTANKNGQIISGILHLNPCFYVGAGNFKSHSYEGPEGLYGFLLSIEELTSNIIGAKPYFSQYVK